MKSTPKRSNEAGFTLVEIIIALSVLAILAGMAIPAFDGIRKEREARAPIDALYAMARDARQRAMEERRPYQLLLDREGFRASRFLTPYGGVERFEELQLEVAELDRRDAMIEASRERGIDLGNVVVDPRLDALQEGLRYLAEYTLEPGLQISVRTWEDIEWENLSGGNYRRWVFQPNGMCEPMRVRVEADDSFFEVEFSPLTADINYERSWVE
ncbi:MAG: prepilin-type N-terminal cleavage/methylation domain-containing protein [Verrucomicrobiota bacterium]